MLMLHQVVPHVHLEGKALENDIQTIAEHHHDGQQHSHENQKEEEEEEDNKSDFWGSLLGNHTHSYHSDFNQRTVNNDFSRSKNGKDFPHERSVILPLNAYENPPPLLGKHPPNPSYEIFFSSQVLRGPPALG